MYAMLYDYQRYATLVYTTNSHSLQIKWKHYIQKLCMAKSYVSLKWPLKDV